MQDTTAQYNRSIKTLTKALEHSIPHRRSPLRGADRLKLTVGNTKIGNDTIIINMGSAHSCASAKLGLCSLAHKKYALQGGGFGDGSCYALKAEYQYPAVLTYRTIQKIQFDLWDADKIAHEIFNEVRRHVRTPIKWVRFNEAGDFHSIEQVRKASKVAEYVKELCLMSGTPVIKFYTYTHRSDIFVGNQELIDSLADNFTINGSNFMVHNNFEVMNIKRSERDAVDNGKKRYKYTCKDDCRKCSLCKVRSRDGIVIVQALH